MEYRKLSENEITVNLFKDFDRYQEVKQCLRKIDGEWIIKDVPFVDQWSEEEYEELVACLINTVKTNGLVYGAFCDGKLKGFVSVESVYLGSDNEYLDLSSLHVSKEKRKNGIGKELFTMAAGWAREHGAKKLYISAHSSVETQAFYKAMGCREAKEYNKEHVEKEPYDCQLEYVL